MQADENSDDDSTGAEFLPDLVLPAGLALGYQWQPPRSARLHEVNPSWQPQRLVASTTPHTEKQSWTNPFDFSFQFNDISRIDSELLNALPEFRVASSLPEESVKSVCIWFGLTKESANHRDSGTIESLVGWFDADSSQLPFDRLVSVGAVVDGGTVVTHCAVGATEPITVGADGKQDENQLPIVKYQHGQMVKQEFSPDEIAVSDPSNPLCQEHNCVAAWLTPGETIIGAGRIVEEILRKYRAATVILGGRMPKCVPLGLGWYLSNSWPRESHPWRRLVPLGSIGIGESRRLRPMWVHPDQVDPMVLLTEAGIKYLGDGRWGR